MSAPTLRCRGLSKDFAARGGAARRVLDGLDLEVAAGTAVVLLGPSGVGKTTLLRVIAGLEAADAGVVDLAGRVLSDPAVRVPPEQRRVGMVFQALELWPHMSIAEHLGFGMPGRPRGSAALREPRVTALAAQVGLSEDLLNRRPDTLSGGEQQRVAIARTLGAEPDVILYDEPLANLDPDRRRTLRALIRRLAREHGTTLVYVTHDPDEALEIGDEVAVLAGGRVVERGAPQALYRRPRTLIGAHALGPVTALPGEIRAGRIHTALGALAFVSAADTHDGGTCFALLRPEDVGPGGADGVEVVVLDAAARARDWIFTADIEGVELFGCSTERVTPGSTVRVTARGPAVTVPLRDEGGAS